MEQIGTYLMIISPLCDGRISRVVRVVVLRTVLKVGCIQGLHAERPAQVLVREPQRAKGVYWIKQLRCHNHRNGEVWPELIVGPLPPGTRSENILVDPSAVDKPSGDLVLGIFGRI
jgi:hypothetical protein